MWAEHPPAGWVARQLPHKRRPRSTEGAAGHPGGYTLLVDPLGLEASRGEKQALLSLLMNPG